MEQIILIGDSGHAKVIEDCIISQGGKVIAKLDDRYKARISDGVILKGPIELFQEILNEDIKVVISIGSNHIRKKIVERLGLSPDKYATIVHNSANVSKTAKLGYGTVIMPGAIVNADALIGNHIIVNSNSVIEHDCVIDDFGHISPGVILTGNVKVGEGSHIGAGVSVIPGIKVGSWSIVGAGAVVTSNIESNVTAVGIPAKVIKREERI